MIKSHLSKILGERRLKISDIAKSTGINRGTLTRIFHEDAQRIELNVLSKLCAELDCTVCDLLEYKNDEIN